ncbi:MAG: hypothetical protein F4X99_13700, partial [Gammaproteobacteria bacterium]|nr:hypothetical protein [Gammaproteobacteria bacterium]
MMQPRGSTLAVLILVALAFRLAPYVLHAFGVPIDPADTDYPWNFSPVLPLCLFGAACFATPRAAYLAPFAIYLAGDLGIWLLTGRAARGMYGAHPVRYISVARGVVSGLLGGRPPTVWR